MNVTYSDNVTNTIKNFRENIYCTEKFKEDFSNRLGATINATNTSYIPEQFGGWAVNITTDNDTEPQSSSYIKIIADVLASAVHHTNKAISCNNLAVNLANVIITGPNSMVVKI